MSRKVVMAMVNGALCIDPSDVEKVDLDSIKAKLREKYGNEIKINVAPISTWMPEDGTQAIMKQAMDKMSLNGLTSDSKALKQPYRVVNRRMRRAMAKAENKKRK